MYPQTPQPAGELGEKRSSRKRLVITISILIDLIALFAIFTYLATAVWPGIGAGIVDFTRGILGDQVVSQIENVILTFEDEVKQFNFRLVGSTPTAPWQVPVFANLPLPTESSPLFTPTVEHTAGATTIPTGDNKSTSTPQPIASWTLSNIPSESGAPGEGDWVPYLFGPAGKVVAYRTFLQPDPVRPYAMVAIVAFDLHSTLLHLVLGYEEPVSSVYVPRPSRIPTADMKPGKILAAFNGGFKTEHGHYGIMLDGVKLIPARDGFGTLVIYKDGKLAIGSWGNDIIPSPDMLAWRQNGPLLIEDGQVNPHTDVNDPQLWGYTTNGDTATGRSGIGIDASGRVLYYAVGFDLVLPALVRAMDEAGVWNAIQLDINNFYTHFEAFSSDEKDNLKVSTLMDQMNGPGDQRYLTINKRDFFYVTTK